MQEALQHATLPDKFDFWRNMATMKSNYVKFCQAYEKRISQVLANDRVICVNEEDPTTGRVTGMITAWRKGQTLARQAPTDEPLELQFLAVDKQEYEELAKAFAAIQHAPRTKPALESLKKQLVLEIKILLGADLPWSKPAAPPSKPATPTSTRSSPRRPAPPAKIALERGGSHDDASGSDAEKEGGSDADKEGAGERTGGGDADGETRNGDGAGDSDGSVAGDGAARRGGGDAEAIESGRADGAGILGGGDPGDIDPASGDGEGRSSSRVLPVSAVTADDFTTWSPANWGTVPWNVFRQNLDSADQASFLAATMAFTDPALRRDHKAMQSAISKKWDFVPKVGDFERMISELLPDLSEGPQLWLTETLRLIKQSKWVDSGTARPPPRASTAAARKSAGAGKQSAAAAAAAKPSAATGKRHIAPNDDGHLSKKPRPGSSA